jgi:hypothetical protein
MTSRTLGNVAIVYRGEYDAGSTYLNGHVAAFGGDTYLCVSRTAIMGIPPAVNGAAEGTHWVLSGDNRATRAAAQSASAAAENADTARAALEAIPVNAAGGYLLLDSDAKAAEIRLPDRLTGAPNHTLTGRDLQAVFGTAAALHAAVAAGDFAKIRVGDYWPLTLTGTYRDYAAGENKTLSSAVLKMEVAGIDLYWKHGDVQLGSHHLLLCARDCLPNKAKMRADNAVWYSAETANPWLGSHLYQTLNAQDGILPLVEATDIGPYLFAGPNGNGMRTLLADMEQGAVTATGSTYRDRGRLFLPGEREVWGAPVWQADGNYQGVALQWPIFAGTLRHIVKGLGNGGSRTSWWTSTAAAADRFARIGDYMVPATGGCGYEMGVAPCFLIA